VSPHLATGNLCHTFLYAVLSLSGPVVKPAPLFLKWVCPLLKCAWPVLKQGGVRLKLGLSPI
jgi:hypothetical protein